MFRHFPLLKGWESLLQRRRTLAAKPLLHATIATRIVTVARFFYIVILFRFSLFLTDDDCQLHIEPARRGSRYLVYSEPVFLFLSFERPF